MKHPLLTALPLAMSLCACAHHPYGGGPDAGQRAIYGAGAGAAVGAIAGAALGGDALGGAAVGALAGGAIGALVRGPIIKGRQYYKDTRGYCYYIDRDGKAHYDGSVRC
jgi:hypothetical protein